MLVRQGGVHLSELLGIWALLRVMPWGRLSGRRWSTAESLAQCARMACATLKASIRAALRDALYGALPTAGILYFPAPGKWGRIAFYVLITLIAVDVIWLLLAIGRSVAAIGDDSRLKKKLADALAAHIEEKNWG